MAKGIKTPKKPARVPSRPVGIQKPPRNRNRYRTRSVTAPVRIAEARRREEEARAAAAVLQAQREEAIRNQPQAPPGNRGDGNLHIAFIRMGQGDCAIMSTPKGRTVLFDCGSDATEMDDDDIYTKFVHDTLYGPKFLKGTNTLDYLILTHPDSDHYNRLKRMLLDDTAIYNVYFSSLLTNYSVNQVSAWIQNHTHERFIKSVTLNHLQNPPQINGRPVPAVTNELFGDRYDTQGSLVILKEENCEIRILCSNVATDTQRDNSNETNRGSLVSLVSAFGKRILVCGDATRSTEDFLVQKYGDHLTNINVVQAPHHGSAVTSSDQRFVNKVKPAMVVVSAGKNVLKDHLPSKITLNKYASVMADDIAPDHELFFWDLTISYFTVQHGFIKKNIWVTGSNSTQTLFLNRDGFQVQGGGG